MSPHLLVTQLRFARSEFVRCFDGVTGVDALRRIEPMNCLSWMVGHLANQENRYWVRQGLGQTLLPGLNDLVGFGKPASTPPLDEMWAAWHTVTQTADAYLDTLTPQLLITSVERSGGRQPESVGTLLLRNIYHYWYHIGEASAVRQVLGHTHLPDFVGDISRTPYTPEG
jgi:hypothetical protein